MIVGGINGRNTGIGLIKADTSLRAAFALGELGLGANLARRGRVQANPTHKEHSGGGGTVIWRRYSERL